MSAGAVYDCTQEFLVSRCSAWHPCTLFHILLFSSLRCVHCCDRRIVVAGTFVRPPRADQAGLTLEQRDETHTGRAHRQVRCECVDESDEKQFDAM
jgi:hypothetical protein